MRELTQRLRRGRDEDGATLVIVVLTLIALFGMLVLVVDVGGLLLKRRALVNGSDAAALSAAKSCIVFDQPAEDAADAWATVNVDGVQVGGTNILQISGCVDDSPNGYVSVRYTSPQNLFFAPVLGFADSGDVTTEATAIWGPPGGANPVPIVIYERSFNNCRLDSDPTPGLRCYVWEDNNNTSGPQSAFGLLDLRTDNPTRYGWDSDPGVVCSNPGNGPIQWISNYPDPDVGDLGLNYPAPTYVCRSSGMQQAAWSALEDLEGRILFFPVNRCYDTVTGTETDGQIEGTDPAPCSDTPDQYDIIGFVALRLVDVLRPNEAQPDSGTCGPSSRGFPASSPLNLDTFGIVQGCFTTAPQNIDGPSVTVRRNGGPAAQRGIRGPDGATCGGTTFDYCYNPGTRTILWNPAGPAPENQNYNVSFDYVNDGPCGIPPGNNSGHCLVVDYVDQFVPGGSGPGEGDPDSNIRAYRLCEPTEASTCDPISVPVP
jgi:hypothetical protein